MTRTVRWRVGDVFLVGNKDGLSTVGQVVGQESEVLNSASVAFFDERVESPQSGAGAALRPDEAFAILFVTRDLLDSGAWPVVTHRPVAISKAELPYEHLRRRGWVGAKVVGSANVQRFLDAFYGLAPWDDFNDPHYLDALLVSSDKKPTRLVLKGDR